MKTLIVMAIFSIIYLGAMELVNKKISSIDFNGENQIEYVENNLYTVSIDGAVNNPGKYSVNKGDNLAYLVTLAGGLKDNADETTYDLTVILEKDSAYYIGYKSEGTLKKVSINEANVALCQRTSCGVYLQSAGFYRGCQRYFAGYPASACH